MTKMKNDQDAKNKMDIKRRIQTEYLINNILDQDFQAMLFPLNFVQSCFLMPRFSIINNFITPDNHVSFYIKSIIGCIILTLSIVFRSIYYIELNKRLGSGVVMVVLAYLDFIYFFIISIVTHIVNSFQRSHVVEIIIQLQHVLDFIKIDKQQFLFKHKIENWVSVFWVIFIYVFHWVFTWYIMTGGILKLLVHFCVIVPLMIFDMQVVHVTRTVVMIKNELIAWIHKMEEYKNIHITPKEDVLHSAVAACDMFNAYTDIMKAFRLSNKVYQFSITVFGFQTFMHILINLQYVIETQKNYTGEINFQTTLLSSFVIIWNFKNFLILVTLSIACENFYRTINLAGSCCAQILSNAIPKPTGMHMICKNVLRLNRVTLRKMSAFGVFELDAAFPLRLVSVIVAYIVVQLQFALLS